MELIVYFASMKFLACLWPCFLLVFGITTNAQFYSAAHTDDRVAATGEVTLTAVIDQSSPAIGCGVPVTLTATVLGATELSWKRNGEFIVGATTPTFIANQSGIYTVVAVSLLCQVESLPVEVILQSPLNASIETNAGNTACEGQSVILQATGGDAQWQWYRDGVALADGVNDTYLADMSGNYVVIGNESSPCASTSEGVTVVIHPLPVTTLIWENNPVICPGDSIMIISNPEANSVVFWYFDEALEQIGGATFIAYSAGDYLAAITDTLTGCSNSTNSLYLEVLPTQEVSIEAETSFCEGQSEVIVITAGEGMIQWYANGVVISGATDAILTIVEGGYYEAEITDANNCRSQSNGVNVETYPLPSTIFMINAESAGLCGTDDTLIVQVESGNAYEWYSSDVVIEGEVSASLEITEPGDYAVQVTNSYGCVAVSEVLNVPLFDATFVELNPVGEVNVCAGQYQLIETVANEPGTYTWYYNGLIMEGEVSTMIEASAAGTYSVLLTNDNGCVAQSASTTLMLLEVITPVIEDGGLTTEGQLLITDGASGHQWYLNGEMIPGATGESYLATSDGVYTVIAIEDVCESQLSEGFEVVLGGIGEGAAPIALYPNPTTGLIVFEHPLLTGAAYTIYTMSGRPVLSGFSSNMRMQLDMGMMSAGMYYMVTGTGEHVAFAVVH